MILQEEKARLEFEDKIRNISNEDKRNNEINNYK